MESNKEKIRIYIIIGLLATIAIWYLFSSGAGSSDTVNTRIQQLENRISNAENKQRETSSAIEQAQGTARDIREYAESISAGLGAAQRTVEQGSAKSETARTEVRNARATVEECITVVKDSRERIERSQQIFDGIEQRNKERAE